ncbi:hypothetical protein [Corallococcus llansteffanensis]|uniref:Cys-rich protein n=1 Tax=Corallococcus llansteffanensis TaxID=2316731 RepID=A0A3A8NWT9_9BACT|nr:hypothetical protein [Corallococcus llansteffanensis]RKH48827.1 hypothetical protein D7V93_32735 [Corallococcus llansteffanensis]
MMTRFKKQVLALGVGALLCGTPALAASKCERRCAEDRLKMEKVCKDVAKSALAMCIKVAGQARDKCMKQCQNPGSKKSDTAEVPDAAQ